MKSALYTLSAVFCWSTVATAFKLTLKGMSYDQLLFYSSFTSCMVLLVISALTSKQAVVSELKWKFLKKNAVLGFLNPFLYYMILFKAYSLLPAQEAQPLNYTWPLTISIFSVIFLKQRLSLRIIGGLLTAFSGVVVIATRCSIQDFEFRNSMGIMLAVGSSLVWALYWVMNLKDTRQPAVKLLGAFFMGMIYTGIYILIRGSFRPGNWIYLPGAVYVGIFEMGITFFLWLKGLELSDDKAKTSTLVYLAPFISLIFIVLILGEKLFLSSIAGLILIIGGILIQRIKCGKLT